MNNNPKGARPVLMLEDINKTYQQGNTSIQVLHNSSFEVYKGEMVSLIGESGCGKSTLLHIAGLLDSADSGSIKINDKECSNIKDKYATEIRKNDIGFVYQYHHLLAEFSAVENVMMPQLILNEKPKIAREKAEYLLAQMGLKDRMHHQPSALSGGEQQRTAIARALANSPSVLLADEPTGNLDPSTSKAVFDVLIEYIVQTGLSMFLVTHNHELAAKTDRSLKFESGKIVPAKNGKWL